MDGPTFLKAIRSAYGALPVLIITGYPDSDLMMQALTCAPVLMLPKPVEAQQILDAVRWSLNRSQRSRSRPRQADVPAEE